MKGATPKIGGPRTCVQIGELRPIRPLSPKIELHPEIYTLKLKSSSLHPFVEALNPKPLDLSRFQLTDPGPFTPAVVCASGFLFAWDLTVLGFRVCGLGLAAFRV